jgi:TM2 domain-containing membrane protein YozV
MLLNGKNYFNEGSTMEKAYCRTCDTDAEIHTMGEIYPEHIIEKIKNKRKSPILAALLSCIIPGLGQVYAGDIFRGLAIIAALGFSFCLMALIIGFFTFFGIWIFAVADAYNMVRKQNDEIRSHL